MDLVILDAKLTAALIRRRRRAGTNRYDEVWDGVYVMSPEANNEHQDIVADLTICFGMAISRTGLGKVQAGANISDLARGWRRNYRSPDVLVFLRGTTAQNQGTHWLGGPDFAVEVISRNDRTRQKFAYYAKLGIRELLIVDRYPWALELHRLMADGTYQLAGRSSVERPDILTSQILPLCFRLEAGEERPVILVIHADGVQTWSA